MRWPRALDVDDQIEISVEVADHSASALALHPVKAVNTQGGAHSLLMLYSWQPYCAVGGVSGGGSNNDLTRLGQ